MWITDMGIVYFVVNIKPLLNDHFNHMVKMVYLVMNKNTKYYDYSESNYLTV